MASPFEPLHIGAVVFPDVDQADLTGPFEVLANLPNSTFRLFWKDRGPVRDVRGLVLTPDAVFAEAPALDLLVVPGGRGQEALMSDETVLAFIGEKAASAKYLLSVCTGALLCGAAGLLKGKRVTTHWSARSILAYFGAVPVDARVVQDGSLISTAGVTAGIDGALRAAALLRGERVAQMIQLAIEYEPEPPFQSGAPQTAPSDVLEAARASYRQVTEARLATARRVAARLGIQTD